MTPNELKENEYGEYYKKYISLVAAQDLTEAMEYGSTQTIKLANSIPPSKYDYSFAEGKWTIKESLLHIIDTERIFAYRALRFARGDTTALPGFEQDDYVPMAKGHQRSFSAIIKEYKSVRQASITLFKSFDEEMQSRIGTASGQPFSARALGYIIAGHEIHHRNILKERYLGDVI